MKSVLIGIQARTGSTRFPNKIHQKFNDQTILENVISKCHNSLVCSSHKVVVLAPKGDKIESSVPVEYGSECDVLSRYYEAGLKYSPDFIVRITADCPLINSHEISMIMRLAMNKDFDYLANVDPVCRTSYDGNDVEVLSIRAINWLNENASTNHHREHVTTLLRTIRPSTLKLGHVMSTIDLSNVKLSVDTIEDLEKMKYEFGRFKEKEKMAKEYYGQNVFIY